MRTITNTGQPLTKPDGTAQSVTLAFQLVDAQGQPVTAFDVSTHGHILNPVSVTADANGEFSVSLTPNDTIAGDTYYRVTMDGAAGYRPFKAKLVSGSGAVTFHDFYTSGQTLTTSEISDLAAHVQDKTNPHAVTTAQVGALAAANNLSDIASATTARTNLGLGSMSTQNANAVSVTGGAVNGTSMGQTAPAAGAFTSITGNLSDNVLVLSGPNAEGKKWLVFKDGAGNEMGAFQVSGAAENFRFKSGATQNLIFNASGNSIFFEHKSCFYRGIITGFTGAWPGNPQNALDVEGACVIGATYSGSQTAPSNGLLVEGSVGLGASSPTAKLDINADTLRLRNSKTPASASAAGNAGDVCWDSNYVYVCVAANTWKRAALSAW